MAKEKLNIKEKLSAIQAELKAPKGQYNKFGKYRYRSAEDIVEAVKPICHKYKTTLVLNDVLVNIGERYYINATAKLLDNESEYSLTANGFAREEENKKGMDGSQITGASSSYSRKYALNGLFCIDDTKDSDATNTHGQDKTVSKPSVAPKKKTDGKIATKDIEALKKALKSTKDKALKQLSNSRTLTKAQANELVKSEVVTKDELSAVEIKG